MIPYSPKELKTNVNVERTSLVRQFLSLAVALVAICAGVYLALGLMLPFVVPYVPQRAEESLRDRIVSQFPVSHAYPKETARLQELVDRMVSFLPEPRQIRVYISEQSQENAFAAPGNTICVFSALVKNAESENEIVAVLGHEIGHILHRHVLVRAGRVLILSLVLGTLGLEEYIQTFLESSLLLGESHFSREQEQESDFVGLELLQRMYGHTAGKAAFFQRQLKHPRFEFLPENISRLFASHPPLELRIQALEEHARARGYSENGALTPKSW